MTATPVYPVTTKCECPVVGYCRRHNFEKTQREWELCRTQDKYFDLWESGKGPQQKRQRIIDGIEKPESLTERLACVHRTTEPISSIGCTSCGGMREVAVYGCKLLEECTVEPTNEKIQSCANCEKRAPVVPRRVIIRDNLCPGDITVLSAAIRELHEQHSKQFETDVRVAHRAIFEGSPHITTLDDETETIEAHYHIGEYATIAASNQRPIHMLEAYCEGLSKALGLPETLRPRNWLDPSIFLDEEEKSWTSQVQEFTGRPTRFWLVNAGTKDDYTAKLWPNYQQVIDQTKHAINWVQIGASEHEHPALSGAISLVGKTDLRQLIRLVYHADGVLCGVTALGHLAHWVERKPETMRQAVIISGGRESPHWFQYPGQHVFHTIGQFDCCERGGCWRSRALPRPQSQLSNESVCDHPVDGAPLCMRSITPDSVSSLLLRLRQ